MGVGSQAVSFGKSKSKADLAVEQLKFLQALHTDHAWALKWDDVERALRIEIRHKTDPPYSESSAQMLCSADVFAWDNLVKTFDRVNKRRDDPFPSVPKSETFYNVPNPLIYNSGEGLLGLREEDRKLAIERMVCAREVCPQCGGRSPQYVRRPVGPNTAGNWVHATTNAPFGTLLFVLCAASQIWHRDMLIRRGL